MKTNKDETDAFIKSSKLIRQQLGVKEADVLATLIYKQDYWAKKGKVSKWKGKEWFFIRLIDIEAETCYSNSIITKCIKKLVKEGLVFKKRQGLNKPNLYSVDKSAVNAFKKSKMSNFNKWQKKIRQSSNSKKIDTERNIQNEESGILNFVEQERSELNTTNNKNTNNKNTNNINTNQASLVEENSLNFVIERLKSCNNDLERESIIDELYLHLRNLVPQLRGFSMSIQDKELILHLCNSEVESWKIVDKIEQNVEYIREGKKESRFGNLFVGVAEIITNYEKCLTNA